MINEESLVVITSADEQNTNLGTGFIIDQYEGYCYILTCAHVLRRAKSKEGKVKVKDIIAEEVAIGTPSGADDLAVLRVKGLSGRALSTTMRNIGVEGMRFASLGYQPASYVTAEGNVASVITRPLQGTLGEVNTQRIRGQGFSVQLWMLNIEGDFLPQPGYSGAPIVVNTEIGEHVIGVLSMQEGDRILAIAIEVLDRVWPEQTHVPFTNREEELQLILSSSAPAYYLLDAPAGYGKSTLLRELEIQFTERKWYCAYLVLESSLNLNELVKAVAEKLSIFSLLSNSIIDQGAGYRLGGALQRYWENPQNAEDSQEGIVLLFDLNAGSSNAELLERLLKEFIPQIEDSLGNISWFYRGGNKFRVVIAGRYLNSYYNRLVLQTLPIMLSLQHLTPFKYDVIRNSSIKYLGTYQNQRTRQIADHILYLTGGHPGCMAKVLRLYKESAMSPETFVNTLSDKIWNEIVKPAVRSIADEFPKTFGIDRLMSNNVLRYMDYATLRKLVDTLPISEVQNASDFDEIDLSDELTGATLLTWNNHLLHDDITRRVICIGLRNERSDEFVRLCQSAQIICEEQLHDNSMHNPDMWVIEYLFQFLQQHALRIGNSAQRQVLRDKFMVEELPKVLQWLVTGRRAREQQRHLLRSIEQDWEFMFTVNYYLRDTEYNDGAIKLLRSEIKSIL